MFHLPGANPTPRRRAKEYEDEGHRVDNIKSGLLPTGDTLIFGKNYLLLAYQYTFWHILR
jgi:hypothetical protein